MIVLVNFLMRHKHASASVEIPNMGHRNYLNVKSYSKLKHLVAHDPHAQEKVNAEQLSEKTSCIEQNSKGNKKRAVMCTKTTHKLSFKTNFLTWKCRESQNQEIKKETVNFWKGRAVYLHIENQKKSLQPNQPQDISFIYQLITKKNPPTTELDYYETIGKPKVTELAKYWLINDFRQKLPLHKKKINKKKLR